MKRYGDNAVENRGGDDAICISNDFNVSRIPFIGKNEKVPYCQSPPLSDFCFLAIDLQMTM